MDTIVHVNTGLFKTGSPDAYGAANLLDGAAARRFVDADCLLLQPERTVLGSREGARASGVVSEVQYFGSFARLRVAADGAALQVDLPPDREAPPSGATVLQAASGPSSARVWSARRQGAGDRVRRR